MYDKKSDPVLTEYDITINGIHQENMFKGTIAVCILYAVFAFILICAAYFSDNIRELLFDKFLPFTLIYIVGTIIIIMIFIYFVLSFEPKKVDINKIDENISCPDYWKLEILDDNVIEKSFDIKNFNKKLFKYRCVMDDKIFNKASIYKQDTKTTTTQQYRLGNKPAFIGNVNSASTGNRVVTNYNDLYFDDVNMNTKLTNFINNDKDNDKYYYLYKDVNAYNNYNLNYANKKIISSNIIDDLKQSALIMNNYEIDSITDFTKYTDLTNAGNNVYDSTATALQVRYTSNYYNSPPILTWATSNAHNGSFTANAYSNLPLANNAIAVTNYTSTVYDWSTMEMPINGATYVYAIDSFTTGVNYLQLGTINTEPIFFNGVTGINIPNGLFPDKIPNNNYYFDTYLTNAPISGTDAKTTNYKKGPKVRLFHKTERQPEIQKKDLDKEHIPLTCSAVYPSFLASKEDKYSENNTLRCAYSKICNIPWSDLHCNDINLSAYPA